MKLQKKKKLTNKKKIKNSFGICLWQILTREEPFTEFQAYDQFANAVCLHNVRPPIPRDCNPYLQKMIERCWDRDPQLRPPFSKIVDALDHIIVEIAISDDVGKKLWKDRFLKKVFFYFLSLFFFIYLFY